VVTWLHGVGATWAITLLAAKAIPHPAIAADSTRRIVLFIFFPC